MAKPLLLSPRKGGATLSGAADGKKLFCCPHRAVAPPVGPRLPSRPLPHLGNRPVNHLPPWPAPPAQKIKSIVPTHGPFILGSSTSSLVSNPSPFRVSFLFLRTIKLIPNSGPRHLLCPLPGTGFLHVSTGLTHVLQVLAQKSPLHRSPS